MTTITKSSAEIHALSILVSLEEASTELVGKAVVLSNGYAGTVEAVSLDEHHGLRISIHGHQGNWPVATLSL